MHARPQPVSAPAGAIPELGFAVQAVRPLEHVAVPTLSFEVAIESLHGHAVRSVLLGVQLQLAARRRRYGDEEQEALVELFGTPERWGTTLTTVPWTRVTAVVPPFEQRSVVELEVICTYDLEVKAARYLNALRSGTVPIELLFSGTVFFTAAGGELQTAMIGWDKEAEYDLPVAAWRRALEHHFPGAAWLRVGPESFERLMAYRSQHQFGSWDEAVDSLLARDGG